MYLKEVRINGFKSFANRTVMRLEPGITAIVGPNGCGKSNTADAIRWVLGEQSAKSLRAGSMQDVIFQGTDTRKAMNLSEVALVFADCEKQLGTAFSEVEITRRVYREGGSDYFLNGKACRLRDIHRLFMDTGVGQVSYSFMLQGQIDQILSTNPSERRAIFEEAAGVTRYKAQRREALLKLGQVDTNLARATDVIEEVGRQIGTLKRQAAKAMRFQLIKKRLTQLDLANAGFRANELSRSLAQVTEIERTNLRIVEDLGGGLTDRDRQLEDLRGKRAEFFHELQDIQRRAYDLRSEMEQAENSAQFSRLRIEDLGKRKIQIENEIRELESQRRLVDEQAANSSATKEQEMARLGSTDGVFQERLIQLNASQELLAQSERDLQKYRQELLMIESSMTRLRSNCVNLEVDLKGYQVRHAGASEAVYTQTDEVSVTESHLATLRRAGEDKAAERERVEEEVSVLKAESVRLRDQEKALRQRVQEMERTAAQTMAQISALERLQEKMEGFSEGAKAVLQGKVEGLDPASAVRLLARELSVDPAWTTAAETLLGPAADALVFRDPGDVPRVASELISKKLGRAVLGLSVPAPAPAGSVSVPNWLRPASSLITSRLAELNAPLKTLLQDCWLCESVGEFLAWWQGHPEFDFTLVASTAGELLDRRGLLHAGQGGKKADSLLARENELARLRLEASHLQTAQASLTAESASLVSRLSDHELNVEDKRSLLIEIGQEASNLNGQIRAADAGFQKARASLEKAEREMEEMEKQNGDSVARLNKAKAELAEGEARVEGGRRIISATEADVMALRGEVDERRESLSEARFELAEKKQRLDALDRAIADTARKAEELDTSATRRATELENLGKQIETLESAVLAQTARAGELSHTLAVTQTSLEEKRAALTEAESAIRGLEDGMGPQREELARAQTELNKAQIRLAREQDQLENIIVDIRKEYQTEVQFLDWRRELWTAGDPLPERIRVEIEDDEDGAEGETVNTVRAPATEDDLKGLEATDWAPLLAERDRLRDRLSSMGPVNLVAIEEYASLKERFTFLKTQSDDLWKAKNELLQAIDEINQTSVTLFRDTFEQVRKNFAFTFQTLFGGGTADLSLIDTGDVLESGIEIIARPPGTKLRTLQLLSGGQRTMTAVGLLFAIYMVKPSPFCLLDELDAPLDDANVQRFTNMVRKFTEYSQFIVITHNKRTIAAADTIYGVTMEEKGVSKLVSMRFDKSKGDVKEVKETAPAPDKAPEPKPVEVAGPV